MTLTFAAIRPLLDQFHGEGLMLSCYVDLSANPGFPVNWPGSFKAKAAAAEQMFANDAQARHEFERNFVAIGEAIKAVKEEEGRGLAVFTAQQRGFLQLFKLDMPVGNEFIVNEAPYLVPLLKALFLQREYLVVQCDSQRARLYSTNSGRLELIEEMLEEVPARQHSAGERWGKQQATIARHREDRILHVRKELVELIEKAWAGHEFSGIVLLGEHEVLEHLRKKLPGKLASKIIHEGPMAWNENARAAALSVRGILVETRQAHRNRVREEVQQRLQEEYALAKGPAQVIEAVNQGQVGPGGFGYLVFGPDPREVVSRCRACRSLWVEVPARCPRCQSLCDEANLWEELLLLAARRELSVHFVEDLPELARYGVAAVLPRS